MYWLKTSFELKRHSCIVVCYSLCSHKFHTHVSYHRWNILRSYTHSTGDWRGCIQPHCKFTQLVSPQTGLLPAQAKASVLLETNKEISSKECNYLGEGVLKLKTKPDKRNTFLNTHQPEHFKSRVPVYLQIGWLPTQAIYFSLRWFR